MTVVVVVKLHRTVILSLETKDKKNVTCHYTGGDWV